VLRHWPGPNVTRPVASVRERPAASSGVGAAVIPELWAFAARNDALDGSGVLVSASLLRTPVRSRPHNALRVSCAPVQAQFIPSEPLTSMGALTWSVPA
jgi:hypothetical protein